MRELYSILPKPSRYIGIEEGIVRKKKEQVRVHIALAFPDMYELGMSYLGHKILAGIINERASWWAERVFAPCPEAGSLLKGRKVALSTLESDTPLAALDAVGFSVTHELCYINILYMLDLAGIPLRSQNRASPQANGTPWPLIIAGGGCTLAAEPLAPFVDIMLLGDGELSVPKVLEALEHAKKTGLARQEFLFSLSRLPGVYVPCFFAEPEPVASGAFVPLRPLHEHHRWAKRQVVVDLNRAFYPCRQTVPFGAVHNRLALEIARGCTRGCRFCQAGIIYRPVRERDVAVLKNLLDECLKNTGYDDVSFLSLSSGDFSALKTLFMSVLERCASSQVSVSLPSLRVGSIDNEIMGQMAGLRRTGATLAPEAGSQRLRDVINKGISESELLLHIRRLYEYGWRHVKLYFMLGLPTETDEDVLAVLDVCKKARDAAGSGIRDLQITAALSPFVPKAHTPFQWEAQCSREEIRRRVGLLLSAIKGEKRIKLRWHDPDLSFLEGIFSRGDRRLADVLERAYYKNAVFPSWMEHFSLEPWLEAMQEQGIMPSNYTRERALDETLPWEHLHSGVSKKFLLRERMRAYAAKTTADCRYAECQHCGVCDRKAEASRRREVPLLSLADESDESLIRNRLNFAQRDQHVVSELLEAQSSAAVEFVPLEKFKKIRAAKPVLASNLTSKVAHILCRYSITEKTVYLSQLELQSIFERVFRRLALPLTFSQGYHPLPLVSFGRALPVGVASECEWISFYLAEKNDPERLVQNINNYLPNGLFMQGAVCLPLPKHKISSVRETYQLEILPFGSSRGDYRVFWQEMQSKPNLIWRRKTKKGLKEIDIRPYVRRVEILGDVSCCLEFDWSLQPYVSPLNLCLALFDLFGCSLSASEVFLTKKKVEEWSGLPLTAQMLFS